MFIWNAWVLKLIGIKSVMVYSASEHYSLYNLYSLALNRLPWWWVLVMRYKYIEMKPRQSPWLGIQQGDRIWFLLCLCSKQHDIFVQECSLWSVKCLINITSAHFFASRASWIPRFLGLLQSLRWMKFFYFFFFLFTRRLSKGLSLLGWGQILDSFLRACVLSHFSHVWLFATLWTVAHQVPLSMGFPRQETQERVVMFSPRGSSQPGDRTYVSSSPVLAGRFFITSATWGALTPSCWPLYCRLGN